MNTNLFYYLVILLPLACVALLPMTEAANSGSSDQHKMQPVESDVHEFMEYAFEPFFEQLKSSLAAPPPDKKAWVPVKANSLVLAESGNLLMLRGPADHRAEWNHLAAELRKQGQTLYQSAKKRNFETTKNNS